MIAAGRDVHCSPCQPSFRLSRCPKSGHRPCIHLTHSIERAAKLGVDNDTVINTHNGVLFPRLSR